jgi:hypothetical protein
MRQPEEPLSLAAILRELDELLFVIQKLDSVPSETTRAYGRNCKAKSPRPAIDLRRSSSSGRIESAEEPDSLGWQSADQVVTRSIAIGDSRSAGCDGASRIQDEGAGSLDLSSRRFGVGPNAVDDLRGVDDHLFRRENGSPHALIMRLRGLRRKSHE